MVESVKITIGGATYEATNAATESTLQDILAAMNKRARGEGPEEKKKKEEAKKEAERAAKMGPAYERAAKAIGRFDKAAQKTSIVVDKMAGRLSGSALNYENTLEFAGNIAERGFGAAGDAAQDFGRKLEGSKRRGLRGFGIALDIGGQALRGFGKLAPAFTAGATMAIGAAEGFFEAYRNVADAGILAGSSFQNLMNTAKDTGLTLAQFGKFVSQNKDRLVGLSGSVSVGAKRVAALGKTVDQDLKNKFIAMGIAIEDIPNYLLDFQNAAAKGGQQLDMTTAAKSALTLAQQMKMLSDLTGKSVDELRAEKDQRALATQAQAKLLELNQKFPGAYEAFGYAATQINARFGEAGVAALNDVLANGRATNEQTAVFLQQNKGAAMAIQEITSGMNTGQINLANATQASQDIIRSHNAVILEDQKALANFARFTQIGDTPLGPLVENLGQNIKATLASINMTPEEYEKMKNIPKETTESIDPTLKAFGNLETGAQTLAMATQQFAADMVNFVGQGSTSIFKTLADDIAAVSKEIHKTIGTPGEGGDTSEGILDTVKSWLNSFVENKGISKSLYGAALGADAAALMSTPAAVTGAGAAAPISIGAVAAALHAASFVADMLGFAEGGVSKGPSDGYLQKLHGTEAVVPLPDGRNIPVKLDDTAFKAMADKLDLVARLNGAMLNEMQRNNNLTRQGQLLAS